jgi:RNA polymerase sigma-70 factor (ECF subfamily)
MFRYRFAPYRLTFSPFRPRGVTKSAAWPVFRDVNNGIKLAAIETVAEAAEAACPPMAADSTELERAFSAVAAGDLDALAQLFDASADELFGLALWRTGSREDAADAVQEVFVRLARRAGRLRHVRDPRAYLLAMAHSAAVDILRRRRRAVELTDDLLEPAVPDHERVADTARLSALLGRLPAAQREAVWLRHFAELSFAEIGEATGVPIFTAASRYRLGIRRLRKLLGVRQ